MYDLKWASELPVSTPHKTNGYRDKVEVERSTLQNIISRRDEYFRALANCDKILEQLPSVQFLTREEAEALAPIASQLKYEYLKASGVPVWSCSGKVVKGSSFYTVKVVPSIDSSG